MRYENIDYVFTSPYERCVETAFYILRIRNDNLKMKIEPGLLEVKDVKSSSIQNVKFSHWIWPRKIEPYLHLKRRKGYRFDTIQYIKSFFYNLNEILKAEYGDLIDVFFKLVGMT